MISKNRSGLWTWYFLLYMSVFSNARQQKLLKKWHLMQFRTDIHCYTVINSWKETINGWGHLWRNGWNIPSTISPRCPNPDLYKMGPGRTTPIGLKRTTDSWPHWSQQTVRPWRFFPKISPKKLSRLFKCPDCGRTISAKSNLSNHRQTNICIRKKCQCWKGQQQHVLWCFFSPKVFLIAAIVIIAKVFNVEDTISKPKIFKKKCHLIE